MKNVVWGCVGLKRIRKTFIIWSEMSSFRKQFSEQNFTKRNHKNHWGTENAAALYNVHGISKTSLKHIVACFFLFFLLL